MRVAEGGSVADSGMRTCCGSHLLWNAEARSDADRRRPIAEGGSVAHRRMSTSGGAQKADQLRIAECGLAVGRRRRISCGSHCGSQKADLFGIAENGPVADRRSQASNGSQKAGQLRIAEGGSAAIFLQGYMVMPSDN